MAAEVETEKNHGTDWEPWWQKHRNQGKHCGLPG